MWTRADVNCGVVPPPPHILHWYPLFSSSARLTRSLKMRRFLLSSSWQYGCISVGGRTMCSLQRRYLYCFSRQNFLLVGNKFQIPFCSVNPQTQSCSWSKSTQPVKMELDMPHSARSGALLRIYMPSPPALWRL